MSSEFEPLKDSQWPESVADLREGFAGRLNVYRVMARHPDLLAAWAPLREHVVRKRAMTDQQSEVVILRTGHNLRAPYEWAHHVSRGRAIGMEDDRIASLGGPLEEMAEDDRILARSVDELMRNAHLLPGTRDTLIAAIGPEGMFDLLATVGFYSVLGFIVNTLDTPIDDDVVTEMAVNPFP